VASQTKVVALVSYLDGADIQGMTKKYMSSKEFEKDMREFDLGNIVHVDASVLQVLLCSPWY
jgi:hypothetical protein